MAEASAPPARGVTIGSKVRGRLTLNAERLEGRGRPTRSYRNSMNSALADSRWGVARLQAKASQSRQQVAGLPKASPTTPETRETDGRAQLPHCRRLLTRERTPIVTEVEQWHSDQAWSTTSITPGCARPRI